MTKEKIGEQIIRSRSGAVWQAPLHPFILYHCVMITNLQTKFYLPYVSIYHFFVCLFVRLLACVRKQ